jgi:hypothetical protein
VAVVTKDVIYLGTLADADTDESTTSIENTSIYQQNFGSAGSPLSNSIEQVSFDDQDNNGSIETNNISTSDTITTVAGTVQLDSMAVVELTVTYSDGSTQAYTDVVMFQTTDGDLFLSNSNFAGTDIRGTGSQTIQSVNVTNITSSNYTGLWHTAFQGFACYVSGTLITTPSGAQKIDTLRVGDPVSTQDHGVQIIRWIGQSEVASVGPMVPIRIRKFALGAGLPTKDLLVSQQHRMLVNSPIIERMIGNSEAFVAAKKLLPLDGVELATAPIHIRYFHLLCDAHEIIFANDAPSETLLPGPHAQNVLGPDALAEIGSIIPEFASAFSSMHAARPILRGPKQRQAVRRHIKNNRSVLSNAFLREKHIANA